MKLSTKCFRPLTGIMVLISLQHLRREAQRYESFRPLTGIMVLITCEWLNSFMDEQKTFPSPYGDYGSYHKGEIKCPTILTNAFPSPYGDYGSYPHPL